VFVTNNSTKSRKQYAKKFDSLGLNVAEVIAVQRVVVVLGEDLVYNIIYVVSFSGSVLTLTLWNLY
jgi:ribonucleotide monophosphatase NagD (HAD superfamily)